MVRFRKCKKKAGFPYQSFFCPAHRRNIRNVVFSTCAFSVAAGFEHGIISLMAIPEENQSGKVIPQNHTSEKHSAIKGAVTAVTEIHLP